MLPALVTDSLTAYRIVFAAEMALAGAIGVLLVADGLRRLGRRDEDRRVALTAIALLPLLLGGVILTRFDLLPAALVAGALVLLVAGRHEAGALVLGIGVAVKLYPAVLVPLAAVAAYRRGGSRALLATVALAAAPVVLLYLPFLVVGLDGVLDSFGRQLGRPLQIESLGAGILLALHHTLGISLEWASGSGSQNLTGGAADTLAVVQGLAQVIAVALVWIAFSRGAMTPERLVRHAAAAVVAFVALSKVLSPQFLVWLLLLVPLVGGARSRRRAVAPGARLPAHRALVPRALLGARARVRPARVVARAGARRHARRPAAGAHVAGHGTRTGSIALARPVAGSHVTSAPSRRTPPVAVSNRTGIPVRMRRIASSLVTPITESCGPVIPTSVSAAVPPGSTRASEVCTWVCVPSTAVTRPSSHVASATFSLVASACRSTTTTGVVSRASSTSGSTSSHMLLRRLEEERAEEVEHRDLRAVARLHEREPATGRGGREVRRPDDRRRGGEVGPDLLPAPRVVAEREGVGACGEQPLGEARRDADAVRDVLAVDDADVDVELLAQAGQQLLDRVTTRTPDDVSDEEDLHRGAALGQRADRRVHDDRDVVPAVRCVRGERLLLDGREIDGRAELRRAGEHRRADGDRGIGPDVEHGHHHGRRRATAGGRSGCRRSFPRRRGR